jgi:hypothetical protein
MLSGDSAFLIAKILRLTVFPACCINERAGIFGNCPAVI